MQADFLNLMPASCRRWTLYNLSWALLALKAALSMTRTADMHGAVVWEYPRFEKKACASANMYARCDAKVTLPLALLAQALPQPGCVYHTHRLTEMQHWLVDEWACLTEWPVLLELRAQQQA